MSALFNFIQDFQFLAPIRGTSFRAAIVVLWLTMSTFVIHAVIHAPGNVILYLLGQERLRQALNRYICRTWSHLFIVYIVSRPRIVLSGDRYDKKANYLVSSNHQVDTDWIWNWALAQRNGKHGNMIIMLKNSAKYVPFFGTAMILFGYIFLKREWEKDKHTIHQTLGHLLHEEDPFWLLIFPEGTRLKDSALELARQFAKEKGMRQPNHVLLPRHKGMNAAMKVLGKRFDHLMDVTIKYDIPASQASIMEIAKGLGPKTIYAHLQSIPMKELPNPEDEQALAKFWYKCFDKKDELLEGFDKDGKFPGPTYEIPVERETWHVNLLVNIIFLCNLWLLWHFSWFFIISFSIVAVTLFLILRVEASPTAKRTN
jgi:1-acyl-sn-glycerol-3-phosphate acyltransferase